MRWFSVLLEQEIFVGQCYYRLMCFFCLKTAFTTNCFSILLSLLVINRNKKNEKKTARDIINSMHTKE
jgi:hypothetical protein